MKSLSLAQLHVLILLLAYFVKYNTCRPNLINNSKSNRSSHKIDKVDFRFFFNDMQKCSLKIDQNHSRPANLPVFPGILPGFDPNPGFCFKIPVFHELCSDSDPIWTPESRSPDLESFCGNIPIFLAWIKVCRRYSYSPPIKKRSSVLELVFESFYSVLEIFYSVLDTFYSVLDTFYSVLDNFYSVVESLLLVVESFYSVLEKLSRNYPQQSINYPY